MSGWEKTVNYRCDSDCRMQGCPGHTVNMMAPLVEETCRHCGKRIFRYSTGPWYHTGGIPNCTISRQGCLVPVDDSYPPEELDSDTRRAAPDEPAADRLRVTLTGITLRTMMGYDTAP